jgi:hypothetical protein
VAIPFFGLIPVGASRETGPQFVLKGSKTKYPMGVLNGGCVTEIGGLPEMEFP